MLRYSSLFNKLSNVHPTLTAPVVAHMQDVVSHITNRANELASHAGRNTVHPNDVAQASLPLCITCENYNSDTQTCHVPSTSTRGGQVGGALPTYDGFCGGHAGQCGVSRNTACVLSGGRARRRSRRRRRTTGGVYDYKGFCGEHLSQCAWADSLAANESKQCGAGSRRRRPHKACKHGTHAHTGGTFDYPGFCGDHLSQCAWADSIANNSTSACKGGKKHSTTRQARRSRHKTRGGDEAVDSLEASEDSSEATSNAITPTTHVLHQRALRDKMMDTYNMRWTASALRLLHQTCRFHLNEVVSRTMSAASDTNAVLDAFREVKSQYQL